jgi:transcriptional regulator of arginine metabolism
VTSADRRRDAVARLLRERKLGTQEALLSALAREGFHATQATLSRDLARLGAHRVSRPEGAFYELAAPAPAGGLAALRALVVGVQANRTLVVIRTAVGAATVVAQAIDDARLPGVLGTIAGDDTIFLAPAGDSTPSRLRARLTEILEAEGAAAH